MKSDHNTVAGQERADEESRRRRWSRSGRALVVTLLVVASAVLGGIAFSGVGATDSSSTDGTAGTSYVTLGGTNQTAVDADGQSSIGFAEANAGDFPTSGTVRLEIPRSSDLRFDRANSSLTVTASGSSGIEASNEAFENARTVVFTVSGASDVSVEELNVTGVRFRVPPTTEATDVTWTYEDQSAAYTVRPESLEVEVAETNVVRGASQQPRGGTRLVVASEAAPQADGQRDEGLVRGDDHHTRGFHAAGENVTVSIPEEHRDDLSFDTSRQPFVSVDSTGAAQRPVYHDEYTLTFRVDERVDAGEEIELDDVRFDTTGVSSPDEPAEFTAALDVAYHPVSAVDSPTRVATGDRIDVHAPTVAIGDPAAQDDSDVTLEAGTRRTTGDNGTHVTVRDDLDGMGGEISSNGQIRVELPADAGVTFDRSQDLEAEAATSGALDGHVVSVSDTEIVVAVDTSSADGNALLIGRSDGSGGNGAVAPLRYNVSSTASGQDVPLVVGTHGGDARVVQDTTGDRDESAVRDIDVVGGDTGQDETDTPPSTDDGSSSSETDTPHDETETDGTETPADGETPTDGETTTSPGDVSTATTHADDQSATSEDERPGPSTASASETTSGFGPGFGLAGAVVALAVVGLLGLRRR